MLINSNRRVNLNLKSITPQPVVIYDNVPLEQVRKYDYLGLTIDERLTFEDHVNKLIANSHNKIYIH